MKTIFRLFNRLICLFKKDKRYKVLTCKQTCNVCPSQWDVYTEDNKYIYIRYRFGFLEVVLNAFNDFGEEPKVLLAVEYGDDYDGYLSFEKLKELTKHIIKWEGCVCYS